MHLSLSYTVTSCNASITTRVSQHLSWITKSCPRLGMYLLTSSHLTVIDAGSLYLAHIILIVISLKLRDFQLAIYCPHTRRWPLLRMGQTRMRRQVVLAVYTLPETLDVLSLCSIRL